MKKLSIVIPCYNSEKTISDVVAKLIETIETDGRFDYEIVLVNDASPDDVYSVIQLLAKQNTKIKCLELARNFGQHAALMAGYAQCTGDVIVSLDDDGQNPPEEVFLIVDALVENNYDVVFAAYPKVEQTWFRRFGSKVNNYMMEKMLGKPKEVIANSYFACQQFVILEMLKYENAFPYLAGLIFRTTKNIGNVIVDHRPRTVGTSGYSFKRLFSSWINGFTAFSIKPLRIATIIGSIIGVCGFLTLIWTIITRLNNPNIPMGYSSIMAVLMFIGGTIMLMLGLIGEYIGRIYISLNNSPQFVIRKSVNLNQDLVNKKQNDSD